MHKKIKIFISLFFIFTFSIIFQISSAKYVIENIYTVAKIDIDRCQPNIELIDIISSNTTYPTYANKTHFITGHIKITEKNIIKNNLSSNNIKFTVGNNSITPDFKSFSLISENTTEKIYEFSFTNITIDGPLTLIIPEGIVEDKSGLVNEQKSLSTGTIIDNTPPVTTFTETANLDGKSKAEITSNESIQPINGWNISSTNTELSKEFSNSISYTLPVTDFAQNSTEVLIDIQNATNILLQYGFFVSSNKQILVSNGQVSVLNPTSSNSIYIKLSCHSNSSLKEKSYIYTNLKNGYTFSSIKEWIASRLKNISDFSIVFQAYVKDFGWLETISSEQENLYQQKNFISAFRINLVPKTEKQYLINFWNRDAGNTHIN